MTWYATVASKVWRTPNMCNRHMGDDEVWSVDRLG